MMNDQKSKIYFPSDLTPENSTKEDLDKLPWVKLCNSLNFQDLHRSAAKEKDNFPSDDVLSRIWTRYLLRKIVNQNKNPA